MLWIPKVLSDIGNLEECILFVPPLYLYLKYPKYENLVKMLSWHKGAKWMAVTIQMCSFSQATRGTVVIITREKG